MKNSGAVLSSEDKDDRCAIQEVPDTESLELLARSVELLDSQEVTSQKKAVQVSTPELKGQPHERPKTQGRTFGTTLKKMPVATLKKAQTKATGAQEVQKIPKAEDVRLLSSQKIGTMGKEPSKIVEGLSFVHQKHESKNQSRVRKDAYIRSLEKNLSAIDETISIMQQELELAKQENKYLRNGFSPQQKLETGARVTIKAQTFALNRRNRHEAFGA